MLIKIREKSGGWIAKAILLVLVVAFAAFFGFGDFARIGGNQVVTVAVVGDTEISARALENEYRVQLRLVTDRLGIDTEEGRRLGIGEAVLQRMIGEALFDQAGTDQGIWIGDSLVRNNIRNTNAFQRDGAFDQALYQRTLHSRSVTEEAYWAQNRRGIARAFLTDSLMGGATAPERLTEAVFRHRQERRVAEIVVIDSDRVGDVGTPDATALGAFHAENTDRFMAPEYRTITLISLTPEALVAEVVVPENEIEDEYAYRGDQYLTPERRDIDQLIYADEAAALTVQTALAEGADIVTYADESGALNAGGVSMGSMSHTDLFDGIADAVFALAEGETTAPLQSPFGWHVIRVNTIEPESQITLEQAREEIERDLALERAGGVLIELGNALQDELAGSASLAEAAARLDLDVGQIEAVDAHGLAPAGVAAAGLPADRESFLSTAFAADVGYETPLVDTADGGAFMLLVERVTPPAARPLESVREVVIEAWRAVERQRAAGELAESLAEEARGGKTLAALAEGRGLGLRTTKPLGRSAGGVAPDVSANLISRLFEATAGDVVTAPHAAGGHVVAQLKEVVAAERHNDDAAFAQIREGLRRGMGEDLMAQYQAHLADDLGVEVNEGTVESLF